MFPPPDLGCYQIAVASDGKVYGCCEGTLPLGTIADPPKLLLSQLHSRLEDWSQTDTTIGCLGCSQHQFMCGIKDYLITLAQERTQSEKRVVAEFTDMQPFLAKERVIRSIRQFFDTQDFHEVLTPVLQSAVPLEPTIYPFSTVWQTIDGDQRLFWPHHLSDTSSECCLSDWTTVMRSVTHFAI